MRVSQHTNPVDLAIRTSTYGAAISGLILYAVFALI